MKYRLKSDHSFSCETIEDANVTPAFVGIRHGECDPAKMFWAMPREVFERLFEPEPQAIYIPTHHFIKGQVIAIRSSGDEIDDTLNAAYLNRILDGVRAREDDLLRSK